MEISQYRSRIIIQRTAVTIDAVGNHINQWEDAFTCWAYANMTSGNEQAEAGQLISSDKVTFTVRWCKKLQDLAADKNRIVFNGKIYNIIYVDDFGYRHKTLKISTERCER